MNRPFHRWIHAVLLLPLGWLTCLKEDPVFFTNAGGWPVPFRRFITLGYYPVLAVMAALFYILWRAAGARPFSPDTRRWILVEAGGFVAISLYIILN